MKLDSKYFDMIRIRPRSSSSRPDEIRRAVVTCQWKGCASPGHHRAPKGRGHESEHYWFCREHVQQYNATYNYFDGMSDSEVEAFRKDAIYGHRPTWRMGTNVNDQAPASSATQQETAEAQGFGSAGAQSFYAWRARQARSQARTDAKKKQRQLKPLEKKSVEVLGLTGSPKKAEIKARFKELVKRHHPDSNGGDRASEEKLREIIQAYNYLKQVGLV